MSKMLPLHLNMECMLFFLIEEADIDLSTWEVNAFSLIFDVDVSHKMQPVGSGNETMCFRKMYTYAKKRGAALWLVNYWKPLGCATVFSPHGVSTAVGKGEWNEPWLGEDDLVTSIDSHQYTWTLFLNHRW
jgi:hypothetical protein